MIQGKHWTALFSHTGTEIVKLSRRLGRTPDVIITNKPPGCDDIHEAHELAETNDAIQSKRAMNGL